MRLRQIITTEEADATSTTAGDIASVAYPLFVAGRTRRARRKNARRAVGQPADSAPSYIGRGVYENQGTSQVNEVESTDDKVTKGLQQLATAGVKLQDLPAFTKDGTNMAKVAESDRIFVVVKIGGANVPYYISTGEGGKASVPTGKWYPFFGLGSSGWLNKGSEQSINKFYGSDLLKTYANLLNLRLGNLQGETLPVMKKTARDVINKDMLNPQNHFTTNEEAVIFKKRINAILQKIGSEPFYAIQASESFEVKEFAPAGGGTPPQGPRTPGKDPWGGDDGPGDDPYSRPEPEYYKRSIDFFGQFEADHFDREDFDKKTGVFKGYWENDDGSFVQIAYFKFDDPQQAAREFDDSPGMGWYYEPVEESVAEAHTLNSDNVIYRLDREDPMNASEVLVLGGAGRYSMAGLRDKARREARALAADLEGNHGGAFRGAAHNIKQLTNTLNTIVAAYNELKRIRSRGGRGSRGITDEDANFIRECLKIAEQWTQRYIAENGRNPGTPIPFPPGTTEIDVSDTTDWYRLGLEISDLDDAEPEEFNQGPPHTVVTFANDEMEQPYLKQFKRLGFKVKDIDQPDVRKFSKQEKKS